MDKPKCAGTAPISVELEAGKKYAWCSCGMSEKQPLCDGNHNQEGCEFRPHVFTAETSETVWFCTCKQTSTPPRCDGTHNTIEPAADGPAAVPFD
ncbi:MAG: CDGSH iron-sulfur domain-containing protein [Pirellulaceae bacterium]